MDGRRAQKVGALGGGSALVVGTVAFALCSPATMGCTTNIVVLTGGAVTSRGCAVYSTLAHAGVGLMVAGAVLLLGSFVPVRRPPSGPGAGVRPGAAGVGPGTDEAGETPAAGPPAAGRVAAAGEGAAAPPKGAGPPVTAPARAPAAPAPRPAPVGVEAVPPGPDSGTVEVEAPTQGAPAAGGDASRVLPPGWYGNPSSPGGAVLWWDGEKLVERAPTGPGRPAGGGPAPPGGGPVSREHG